LTTYKQTISVNMEITDP